MTLVIRIITIFILVVMAAIESIPFTMRSWLIWILTVWVIVDTIVIEWLDKEVNEFVKENLRLLNAMKMLLKDMTKLVNSNTRLIMKNRKLGMKKGEKK